MTAGNVTDMREWEANQLIARDAEGFAEAMKRAERAGAEIGGWAHCTAALLKSGVTCGATPRRACNCAPANGGHDHAVTTAEGEQL